MTGRAISAMDVARRAGVSRAAVSRCFTPGASISDETRARVVSAAHELGYEVNRLARGLIRNETGLVALIAAEIGTPYRSQLLTALTQALQEAGKIAILINTDRSDESVDRALRQAISYRTDAAVFLSGLPARSLAETCIRNGMRLVLINRDEVQDGAFSIRVDDVDAGRQAVQMLLAAGCTRLALASSLAGTPSITGREEGFRAAVRAAGLPLVEARMGATSYGTGIDLGMALLGRGDRPDGIFCTTDLMACGIIDTARCRLGIDVPGALSVIGFDDIPQAAWEGYALSTFAQPVDEIARQTALRLLQPGPFGAGERCQLPVRFIARGSVRRPVRPPG